MTLDKLFPDFIKKRRKFRKKFNKWFIFFDCLFVLMILMNFGALFITNVMVVKDNPHAVFYEINPAVYDDDNYNFAPPPDKEKANEMFTGLLRHAGLWSLLTICYLILRQTLTDHVSAHASLWAILYLFFLISLDFINDFGYLVGKWIFGG